MADINKIYGNFKEMGFSDDELGGDPKTFGELVKDSTSVSNFYNALKKDKRVLESDFELPATEKEFYNGFNPSGELAPPPPVEAQESDLPPQPEFTGIEYDDNELQEPESEDRNFFERTGRAVAGGAASLVGGIVGAFERYAMTNARYNPAVARKITGSSTREAIKAKEKELGRDLTTKEKNAIFLGKQEEIVKKSDRLLNEDPIAKSLSEFSQAQHKLANEQFGYNPDGSEKSFTDLIGEGKIGQALGKATLAGAESAPTSILAAATGGIGLGLIGVSAAENDFRSTEGSDMTRNQRVAHALATGAIETATEKIGADQLVATARIFKEVPADVASQVVGNVLKRNAVLLAKEVGKNAAAEAIEEGVGAVAGIPVDYLTNAVSQEVKDASIWDQTKYHLADIANSMVYGAAGGMQGGVTVAGVGLGARQAKINAARENEEQTAQSIENFKQNTLPNVKKEYNDWVANNVPIEVMQDDMFNDELESTLANYYTETIDKPNAKKALRQLGFTPSQIDNVLNNYNIMLGAAIEFGDHVIVEGEDDIKGIKTINKLTSYYGSKSILDATEAVSRKNKMSRDDVLDAIQTDDSKLDEKQLKAKKEFFNIATNLEQYKDINYIVADEINSKFGTSLNSNQDMMQQVAALEEVNPDAYEQGMAMLNRLQGNYALTPLDEAVMKARDQVKQTANVSTGDVTTIKLYGDDGTYKVRHGNLNIMNDENDKPFITEQTNNNANVILVSEEGEPKLTKVNQIEKVYSNVAADVQAQISEDMAQQEFENKAKFPSGSIIFKTSDPQSFSKVKKVDATGVQIDAVAGDGITMPVLLENQDLQDYHTIPIETNVPYVGIEDMQLIIQAVNEDGTFIYEAGVPGVQMVQTKGATTEELIEALQQIGYNPLKDLQNEIEQETNQQLIDGLQEDATETSDITTSDKSDAKETREQQLESDELTIPTSSSETEQAESDISTRDGDIQDAEKVPTRDSETRQDALQGEQEPSVEEQLDIDTEVLGTNARGDAATSESVDYETPYIGDTNIIDLSRANAEQEAVNALDALDNADAVKSAINAQIKNIADSKKAFAYKTKEYKMTGNFAKDIQGQKDHAAKELERKADLQAKSDELDKQIEYWNEVKDNVDILTTDTKVNGVEVKDVPEVTKDKPVEARKRGFRKINGDVIERQAPIANKAVGEDTEVFFSNTEKAPAKISIIDASQLQPSHLGGVRNNVFFLDEAQPKERTGEQSTAQAKKIAKAPRIKALTSTEVSPFEGTPVTNDRGEVIQGNNRSEAIKIMYDSHPKKAAEYKQYLIDNAEQFGLTKKGVEAIENPVLVREVNVKDDRAIFLGQIDPKSIETEARVDIDAKNLVKVVKDKVERVISYAMQEETESDRSIREIVRGNAKQVLQYLVKNNFITQEAYTGAFNKAGNITDTTVDTLVEVVKYNFLGEGNVDLENRFNSLPVSAQKAILQTSYRDYQTSNISDRYSDDFRKAIELFYELNQSTAFEGITRNTAKDKVRKIAYDTMGQVDMFTNKTLGDAYSDFQKELAVLFQTEKQTALRILFNDMYDMVQKGKADSVLSMDILGEPKTRKEAIEEIFNIKIEDGKETSATLDSKTETSEQGEQRVQEADKERAVDAESKGPDPVRNGSIKVIGDNELVKRFTPLAQNLNEKAKANVVLSTKEDLITYFDSIEKDSSTANNLREIDEIAGMWIPNMKEVYIIAKENSTENSIAETFVHEVQHSLVTKEELRAITAIYDFDINKIKKALSVHTGDFYNNISDIARVADELLAHSLAQFIVNKRVHKNINPKLIKLLKQIENEKFSEYRSSRQKQRELPSKDDKGKGKQVKRTTKEASKQTKPRGVQDDKVRFAIKGESGIDVEDSEFEKYGDGGYYIKDNTLYLPKYVVTAHTQEDAEHIGETNNLKEAIDIAEDADIEDLAEKGDVSIELSSYEYKADYEDIENYFEEDSSLEEYASDDYYLNEILDEVAKEVDDIPTSYYVSSKERVNTKTNELIEEVKSKLSSDLGESISKYSILDTPLGNTIKVRIADHSFNPAHGKIDVNVVIADKDHTQGKYQGVVDLRFNSDDSIEDITSEIKELIESRKEREDKNQGGIRYAIRNTQTEDSTIQEESSELTDKEEASENQKDINKVAAPDLKGIDNLAEISKVTKLFQAKRFDKYGSKGRFLVGEEIKNVYKAINEQIRNEKEGMKLLTDVARLLVRSGNLSKRVEGKMLTILKNASTKKDVVDAAQAILTLTGENTLKNSNLYLDKVLSGLSRTSKQKGIKESLLGENAREFLEAFKEYKDYPLEKLNEIKEEQFEESGNKYFAAQLASKYVEIYSQGKQSLNDINETIETKESDLKKAKGEDRTPIIEELRALRELKLAYLTNLSTELDKITDELYNVRKSGKLEKKAFKDRQYLNKQRIEHFAASDLKSVTKLVNPKEKDSAYQIFKNTIFSHLRTFEFMLKSIGTRALGGRGYLYDYFVPRIMKASDNFYMNKQSDREVLDNKVKEIFGNKYDWLSVMKKLSNKMIKDFTLEIETKNGKEAITLTNGQAVYVYMVNKMTDGKVKLANMGITDEMVEKTIELVPVKLKQLADYLQEDFLPMKRNIYNDTHIRVFGTSMDEVENYVPLRINLSDVIKKEDVDDQSLMNSTYAGTTTGAIKRRVFNKYSIDIANTDFMDTIAKHLDEMEKWNTYVEIKQDINNLLSNRNFREKLVSLGGKGYWNTFKDVAKVATGSYVSESLDSDNVLGYLFRGAAVSKVLFRLNTAIKQTLSITAMMTEPSITFTKSFAKNIARPISTFVWAARTLPNMKKRWGSKFAGDEKLLIGADKKWIANLDKFFLKYGMTPNAAVDAITCSIGAKARYDQVYKESKRKGLSDSEAKANSIVEAEIFFNLTQQSAEDLFLAKLQKEGKVSSQFLTLFNNATFAYGRRLVTSSKDIVKILTNKEEVRAFTEKKLMREQGKSEIDNVIRKEASKQINKSLTRDILSIGAIGFISSLMWEMGGSMYYFIAGDDEDKKKKILSDAISRFGTNGLRYLFTGGGLVEGLVRSIQRTMDGKPFFYSLGDQLHPAISDLTSDTRKMMKAYNDSDAALMTYTLLRTNLRYAAGIDMQTFSNALFSLVELSNEKNISFSEIAYDLSYLLNVPPSQIKELALEYKKGESLNDYIKRYIDYKENKKYGILAPLHDTTKKEYKKAKRELIKYNKERNTK